MSSDSTFKAVSQIMTKRKHINVFECDSDPDDLGHNMYKSIFNIIYISI